MKERTNDASNWVFEYLQSEEDEDDIDDENDMNSRSPEQSAEVAEQGPHENLHLDDIDDDGGEFDVGILVREAHEHENDVLFEHAPFQAPLKAPGG